LSSAPEGCGTRVGGIDVNDYEIICKGTVIIGSLAAGTRS
jgi:hypothetical protein